MIPEKIHYCWFGKGELPPVEQKCIESWRKYCPDSAFIGREKGGLMDMPDSSFDFIICNHVPEHVHDYKKALCELHRVLRARVSPSHHIW